MRMKCILCAVFPAVLTLVGVAEEPQREVFQKWRVSFGGAFNSKVRSKLGMRDFVIPAGQRLSDAQANAAAYRFDGGGYINREALDANGWTEDWQLPVSSYDQGRSCFELYNSYVDGYQYRNDSDDRNQFGLSVEIARELWIHDEEDEHRWGVDFAAAFSYFFAREIFNGAVSSTTGKLKTTLTDEPVMDDYKNGLYSPVGGMYGFGNPGYAGNLPALSWGTVIDDPAPEPLTRNSIGLASGDYQELEMLFLFRPWYEITDWWRIYAEVGVGVSWGRFDASFSGNGISAKEKFSQWDCYGVAGLGTAFRYDDWTLGIDFLGRFLRDDLDVDGKYVKGSIERSNWGFRVMLGYEF